MYNLLNIILRNLKLEISLEKLFKFNLNLAFR